MLFFLNFSNPWFRNFSNTFGIWCWVFNWSICVSSTVLISLKFNPWCFTFREIMVLRVLISAWKWYNIVFTPFSIASLLSLLDFKKFHIGFSKHQCISKWAFRRHLLLSHLITFLNGKKKWINCINLLGQCTFEALRGWYFNFGGSDPTSTPNPLKKTK